MTYDELTAKITALYEKDALLIPPEKIYHYTDMNALVSIMENNMLWATHSGFLNDKEELFYATKLICEILSDFESEQRSEFEINCLQSIKTYYENYLPPETYIVSFCNDRDKLSQWRGYAANGQGVSIGFDLTNLAMQFNSSGHIFKIIYRLSDQKNILRTIITHCLNFYRALLPNRLEKDLVENFLFNAKSFLDFAVPLLKDPGFSEENESRLLIRIRDNEKDRFGEKFRAKSNFVVPYVELKFNRSPILEIIAGPQSEPQLAVQSIKKLMIKLKLNVIPVERSLVPYRG